MKSARKTMMKTKIGGATTPMTTLALSESLTPTSNISHSISKLDDVTFCKYCKSENIKKRGTRKNKSGMVQLFKCRDCKKTFSANFGFRYRRYSPELIGEVLHLYYFGMSTRAIAAQLAVRGIKITNGTIYKWLKRYSQIVHRYTESLTPRVGNWYRADEVWVKIMGHQCYLFASMDDDTRYWIASDLADNKFQHNADKLLQDTVNHTGKIPRNFITDGLAAYKKSARKVFGTKTYHISDVGIVSKRTGAIIHPTNNMMERLNGTIRDREKTFRGLGTMKTPVLDCMKVHYNHVRKHDVIKKTPAESAGIHTEGNNKWKTLIQNSSVFLIKTDQRV